MQAARRRGIRLPQPEGAVETQNSSRRESPDISLGSDLTGHGSQVDDEDRVSRFPRQARKASNAKQGVGCVARLKSSGTFKDTS